MRPLGGATGAGVGAPHGTTQALEICLTTDTIRGETDVTVSMAFAAARMITEREKARKTSLNRNMPTV